MSWGCKAGILLVLCWCHTSVILDVASKKFPRALVSVRCNVYSSLPGRHANACVQVKCWVPEKERSLGWRAGAAGCCHTGVGVCAGVRQRRCGSVWGRHRSGRGGLHRGVTPVPGYSVQPRQEQTERERLLWLSFSVWAVNKLPL